MSVGVLLITHDGLGDDLLNTVRAMMGATRDNIGALRVSQQDEPHEILGVARQRLEQLERDAGVLILTDAFGSTPSNIAQQLASPGRVAVVAGVNLPMLIRVLNYPALDLQALTEKALSGGRDGVVLYEADGPGR